VNESLLGLHKVAGEKGDAHLCDFLESEFLNEQVESIKKVRNNSANIRNFNRFGERVMRGMLCCESGSAWIRIIL
jgi:ferritin heavy chain